MYRFPFSLNWFIFFGGHWEVGIPSTVILLVRIGVWVWRRLPFLVPFGVRRAHKEMGVILMLKVHADVPGVLIIGHIISILPVDIVHILVTNLSIRVDLSDLMPFLSHFLVNTVLNENLAMVLVPSPIVDPLDGIK